MKAAEPPRILSWLFFRTDGTNMIGKGQHFWDVLSLLELRLKVFELLIAQFIPIRQMSLLLPSEVPSPFSSLVGPWRSGLGQPKIHFSGTPQAPRGARDNQYSMNSFFFWFFTSWYFFLLILAWTGSMYTTKEMETIDAPIIQYYKNTAGRTFGCRMAEAMHDFSIRYTFVSPLTPLFLKNPLLAVSPHLDILGSCSPSPPKTSCKRVFFSLCLDPKDVVGIPELVLVQTSIFL